ncbi:Uncharacterised protein [Enterobacter cloacae]|nr:Uncharacterised protein [Enterobacter cloacae]
MDVNDAVFIQCAEVNGLFRQPRKFTHLNVSAADQIHVLQGAGTQFKQFQGQRIFF